MIFKLRAVLTRSDCSLWIWIQTFCNFGVQSVRAHACKRVSIIIVVLFSYFSLGLQGENLSTQYQPRHLLELLEVIFCQFRCVANIHKIVLQNLHRIIVSA